LTVFFFRWVWFYPGYFPIVLSTIFREISIEAKADDLPEACSVESAEESATSTNVEQKDQPNIDTESKDLLVESMEDSIVNTEGELINEPVEDA